MLKPLQTVVFIFSVINLLQISSSETPVRKCLNGELKPLTVQVDSCTEMPCELWRGFTSNMAIQFVSTKNSLKNIKANISMSLLGIGMPFAMKPEQTNVCENLMFGANCPMDEGEDATYHLILDIGKHQPEVPAKLEVSIRDATDETILACFILDARIANRHYSLPKN